MVNKKNHKIYFGFFNKILSTSKISHKSIRRSEIKYAKSELSVTGNMHFIIKQVKNCDIPKGLIHYNFRHFFLLLNQMKGFYSLK